jgi:Tfp pilus assembly protein PilP
MNRSGILVLVALLLVGVLVYSQFSSGSVDVRTSINSGIEKAKESTKLTKAQEELLKLQLALADFTASNGAPPPSLDSLVPKYFDAVPKNPNTGLPYEYKKKGPGYALGSGEAERKERESAQEILARAGLGGEFVNPNQMQLVNFTYDPTNRRDPFKPFNSDAAEIDYSLPPLQRYELGQLKVTAILADIAGSGGRTAIVEDASGRGYPIKKGVRIGNRKGVVVAIDEDKIHVLETIVDFTGKEKKFPRVLKLNKRQRDINVQDAIQRNTR